MTSVEAWEDFVRGSCSRHKEQGSVVCIGEEDFKNSSYSMNEWILVAKG